MPISDYSIEEFLEFYGERNVISYISHDVKCTEISIEDFVEYYDGKNVIQYIDDEIIFNHIDTSSYLDHIENNSLRGIDSTLLLSYISDYEIKRHHGTDIIRLFTLDEIFDEISIEECLEFISLDYILEYLFHSNRSKDFQNSLLYSLFDSYLDVDDVINNMSMELLFDRIFLNIFEFSRSNNLCNCRELILQLDPDYYENIKINTPNNSLYNYMYAITLLFEFFLNSSIESVFPSYKIFVSKGESLTHDFNMNEYTKMINTSTDLIVHNFNFIYKYIPEKISYIINTPKESDKINGIYPNFFKFENNIETCNIILDHYSNLLTDFSDEPESNLSCIGI